MCKILLARGSRLLGREAGMHVMKNHTNIFFFPLEAASVLGRQADGIRLGLGALFGFVARSWCRRTLSCPDSQAQLMRSVGYYFGILFFYI